MSSRNNLLCLAAAASLLLAAQSAFAGAPAGFEACVADLRQQARGAGISEQVLRSQLDQVEFVDRVVELDRSQPEFTATFGRYLDRRVTEGRVERGRALLEEHAGLLQRVYRDYGVAPRYLVAFWGLETNYGGYFGDMRTVDVLTTLACDRRRPDFFTRELMAALRLIDSGGIAGEQMRGSWAGALGHVQFMPSVYERYAVDYDGDGQRDLWNSVPDAMASAANYLRTIGWRPGWRWGREVALPASFPFEVAGHGKKRTVSEWRELGVETAYGRPLRGGEATAELLVPAGHEGPAFLVYSNFDIIMQWNRSQLYALSVGHLADRLVGVSGLANPPPADREPLRREVVVDLQERLNQRGFEAGPVDGIPGPSTREAIRRFQKAHGMIADGYPSRAVLDRLSLKVAQSEVTQ